MTAKKILIIDDDVTALDIVDFLFEDKGFDVVRCTNGISALECLTDVAPNVILIDLMMPQMSGQECIRHIRDRGVKTPIVAFTALDDADIHREATDAGANIVLTKPCKPAVLVNHIESLLKV